MSGFTQPESMSAPQIVNGNDPGAFDPNMGGDSTILPQNLQHMQPPVQQQFQQQPMMQQGQPMMQQQGQMQPQMPPQQQRPQKYVPPHCIYLREDGNPLITIALPGVEKDKIDIEYDEPVIRISCKREKYSDDMVAPELKHNVGTYFGDIVQEFKMSKAVDSLDASIENGMVILDIKFRSKKEPAKIKLK